VAAAELVEVSLKREGARAEFRVRPRKSAAGNVLLAMGFQPREDAFVRSFPDSDDVPRIFGTFSAHIDEMIRFKSGDAPPHWERALELVDERLTGHVDWWLSGSAALAVRGIDLRPRDIDLVVGDARQVGHLLNDILVEPVTRMHGWIADWFGRAFDGALIEWVSHVHADVDTAGPHEQGPVAANLKELVVWRGHKILCSPLDVQLAVCEARRLDARAEAIRLFTRRGRPPTSNDV
jgi:hypothetical protein